MNAWKSGEHTIRELSWNPRSVALDCIWLPNSGQLASVSHFLLKTVENPEMGSRLVSQQHKNNFRICFAVPQFLLRIFEVTIHIPIILPTLQMQESDVTHYHLPKYSLCDPLVTVRVLVVGETAHTVCRHTAKPYSLDGYKHNRPTSHTACTHNTGPHS